MNGLWWFMAAAVVAEAERLQQKAKDADTIRRAIIDKLKG